MVGSVATSCPKQSYCQIVGCKIGHRKHSKFLHPKEDKSVKTEPASPSETKRTKTISDASSPFRSCANYALQKTADENADHFNHEAIQAVKQNFYVDDCLKSVEDDQ